MYEFSMKNEIHIDAIADHGIIATGSREPLMNANDHVPMTNIMPFGFCKKGMPCMPLTPVAWVDVNKKHIIDGAPALTEDSKLACAHGGVITIVPLDAGSAEEGDRNENAEDVVEEIASAALSILGSIVAKRIPFMKKLVKMKGKKKSVKGGGNKGSGSNSVENSGAASNRSSDRSGNSGGGVNKAGKLSASNVRHISKHIPSEFAQQAKFLNDESLAKRLSKTTFFNPKWTKEQVVSNTEEAYNILRSQGKTGLQSYKINGDEIMIFIKSDGTFDTAYGLHKLTVDFFRK